VLYEFKLPDIGEGLHEAEIVRWMIKEGDDIKVDQPIAEIQTDKATVEISTPVGGRVLSLAGPEGATVKVGEAFITVDTAEHNTKTETVAPSPSPTKKRVIAAPSVRKRARELKIPIEEVEGTGDGGRVTLADLERYSQKREQQSANIVSMHETRKQEVEQKFEATKQEETQIVTREERIPIRGLRKKIAENMVKSAYTVPHVTGMDEVDVTKLVNIRANILKQIEGDSMKLTYLPFVIKAVTRALKEHPIFNATIDEETNEIVLKKEYHIGIATATKEGLVVPVIKHADQKSIRELAQEIAELSAKAHQQTLKLDEIQGSTFTITSTGANGGWFATPIIHYPEVAILGVHSIKRKPVVIDEEIVIRSMMGMSITFDHRIIDGEPAGRFMTTIKYILENPEWLLLDVR
jgi:pyruvate dehydrogenase E2 component (dihydrolipoamide acetyltransferase)